MIKKSLFLLTLLFSFSFSASATTFNFAANSSDTFANSAIFEGSGTFDVLISYDDVTEILDFNITYNANQNGFLTNFFFFTITQGGSPAAGTNTTVFFDASQVGAPVISAYSNVNFDGSTQPIIDTASGALRFSTLNGPAAEVLNSSSATTATTATYNLRLDSALLPGVDFGSSIGIWLQSAGLFLPQGTFATYDAATGRFSELVASIASDGGYGFFDIEGASTTVITGDEVPEPLTSALLLMGVIPALARRRN